jgi:hypothetical protein
MVKSLRDIVELAKARGTRTCAVVAAEDPEVLLAVDEAVNCGIAKSILIGNLHKIEEAAGIAGVDISKHELVEEDDPPTAARKGVKLVSEGERVGQITNSPLTLPTFTPPTGSLNGISEIAKAAEAPMSAVMSGSLSCSTDNTVQTTCTSCLNPSGNKGLRGLSIIRAEIVAASEGLPSRFIQPPGIFPTA